MIYTVKIAGLYIREINYNEDGSFKTVPMTKDKEEALKFDKIGKAKELALKVGGTVEVIK